MRCETPVRFLGGGGAGMCCCYPTAEWVGILAHLKKLPGIHVGQPDTCRQFMSACLWILRSGSQWRVLPPTHGKWNSIFKRFSRWCAKGVWDKLLSHFSELSDL